MTCAATASAAATNGPALTPTQTTRMASARSGTTMAAAGIVPPESRRPDPRHGEERQEAEPEHGEGEPVVAFVDRGLGEQQLGPEAGERRHAGERQCRDHEQEREPRPLPPDAAGRA